MEVTHGRGYVYSIQYHIVWCVKYRHKIITDKIENTEDQFSVERSSQESRGFSHERFKNRKVCYAAALTAKGIPADHIHKYGFVFERKRALALKLKCPGMEFATQLTDQKTRAVYKVTRAGKTGGIVAYMGSTDKKATKIVIPATVTIDGITYKVTSIGAKAFEKNKTVQKIIIGKNVEKIGKKAFFGCRNLKKIVIRTTRLTDETVGSKAFQKIAAKAKIRVPEEKLDTYIKLLAAKGLGDKAVVKKQEKDISEKKKA